MIKSDTQNVIRAANHWMIPSFTNPRIGYTIPMPANGVSNNQMAAIGGMHPQKINQNIFNKIFGRR